MARRAIPMIAFPRVRTIFNRTLAPVRVVYVVKEVASVRGLGQLMGVARNRTRARAMLQQQEERKLLRRNWNFIAIYST